MRTKNVALSAGFCLLSIVAIAACQQEVGAPVPGSTAGVDDKTGAGAAKRSTTLVAKLDLGDDHVVQIYELASGGMGVHEMGRTDSPGRSGSPISVNDDMVVGKSMADLYQLLTADRPELRKSTDLEALKLADTRALNYEPPPERDVAPEVPPQMLASAAPSGSADFDPYWDAWFIDNFCGDEAADRGWCNMHWYGNAAQIRDSKYNFTSTVDNKGNNPWLVHMGEEWICPLLTACYWEQDYYIEVPNNTYSQFHWTTRRRSLWAQVYGHDNGYNFGGRYTNTSTNPPPPSICGLNQACCPNSICAGSLLTCVWGTCVACGLPGQPCCASNNGNPPGCVNGGTSTCDFATSICCDWPCNVSQ